MNELEIEELGRNLAENGSYKEEEEEKTADDTGSNVGQYWKQMRRLEILRKKRFPLLKK